MKKNEIFTFTAPNGAEVVALCLKSMGTVGNMTQYLCYGQNRLFTMEEFYSEWIEETGEVCQESQIGYGETLVEYAILPEYDDMLEAHHQHEESIKIVQGFGYTRAEASNILEGRNADGSDFERLPF